MDSTQFLSWIDLDEIIITWPQRIIAALINTPRRVQALPLMVESCHVQSWFYVSGGCETTDHLCQTPDMFIMEMSWQQSSPWLSESFCHVWGLL